MTVKDEKGRLLVSQNPIITEMWEKAGYEKVTVKQKGTKKNLRNAQRK